MLEQFIRSDSTQHLKSVRENAPSAVHQLALVPHSGISILSGVIYAYLSAIKTIPFPQEKPYRATAIAESAVTLTCLTIKGLLTL